MRKGVLLAAVTALVVGLGLGLPQVLKVSFFYFLSYVVLQYVILSTAWNLLGGFTGYVNFGVGAFFALGAYTAAFLTLNFKASFPVVLVAGGLASAALGLGIGYLTLRLRGVYFAIATLAMAVVMQMVIVNTQALGGARGLYIFRPRPVPPFSTFVEFLFAVMLVLALLSALTARFIEKSWIGRGFTAIRDSEEAAECMGVPVFRLKLLATTLSGFLMGLAGAPFPFYITYLEPYSAMALDITVNSLTMSLIGGTATWLGPVVGAILLGTAQQVVTVTVSSEYNLLIVGVLLLGFVILAPTGIVGLFQGLRGREKT